MSAFDHLMSGFAVALTWKSLFYCFIGCFWGTIVGVLPGLGPLAGMVLLLPLTFGLDPATGIIMLTGIFYGAMYGGSTTSILVRIPGEAASVITCLDGYEMARRGRAGPALMIAAVGSFIGGTASVLGLMLVTPPLSRAMLQIGPQVEVVLMVMALCVIAFISGGSRLKTAAMIVLGLIPKMGALVESLPTTVLGGAGLVMFGMVAATGVRILARVDFATNRHNLFIVAISVGMGMIPLVAPNFNQWMPHAIHPLIHSGILLAAISAVLLNWFYNGAPHIDEAELREAGHVADH